MYAYAISTAPIRPRAPAGISSPVPRSNRRGAPARPVTLRSTPSLPFLTTPTPSPSPPLLHTARSETRRFPSISDEPSLLLSVVVPAYKESKRIGSMMKDMLAHLDKTAAKDKNFTWEIIIVDDGSPPDKDGTPDRTIEVVQSQYVNVRGSEHVRLLKLFKNHGKGGAVRKGVLRARGQYILFADADGATTAADLSNLLVEIKKIERDGLGIAVGSRASAQAEEASKANRTFMRKLLGLGFRTLISVLVGGHNIQDTQCGFKMFTRRWVCLLERGYARVVCCLGGESVPRHSTSPCARPTAFLPHPLSPLPSPHIPAHPSLFPTRTQRRIAGVPRAAHRALGVRRGAALPRRAFPHSDGGGAR
jgi:hypothetical protein